MHNEKTLSSVSSKKGESPLNDEILRWQWYGHCDVMDGLGYRKSYEDCEEHIQRNYELGRAKASVLKYEWGVVPEWPANERFADRGELMKALKDVDVFYGIFKEQNYHMRNTIKRK